MHVQAYTYAHVHMQNMCAMEQRYFRASCLPSLHIKGLLSLVTYLVNDVQLELSYLFGAVSQYIALDQTGEISEPLSFSRIVIISSICCLFMRTQVSLKS